VDSTKQAVSSKVSLVTAQHYNTLLEANAKVMGEVKCYIPTHLKYKHI